jgi:hypothetical protein
MAMKIYNLRRFSNPEFLRRMSPGLLREFMERFPECAMSVKRGGTIDYEKLALLLANPVSGTDTEMFDALGIIDEMSADRHFDLLQEVIEGKYYAVMLGDNASSADVALSVWLHEPWILQSLHARRNQCIPKSFAYFRGCADCDIARPGPQQLNKLTRFLNEIFQRKRRGRSAKVTMFEEYGEYHFIIRKGEAFARDGAICTDGHTECVYYRPERFDLAALRPKVSELRLAVCNKAPWLIKAYRTLFGYVLYDDREHFSDTAIFTLAPLRENGAAALSCRDIPGMVEVKLMQCKLNTDHGETIAVHGEHAMQMLNDADMKILQGTIQSAKFNVRFCNAQATRIVTVKNGNLAEFKFDDDGKIIEQWLVARGFKNE